VNETRTQALALLRAMRELLSVPERWTQGGSARDANGWLVVPSHPDAVRWCIAGAKCKIDDAGGYSFEAQDLARQWLNAASERECGVEFYVDGNDQTDHAGALRIIDTAIEIGESDARD
jgi:hypothetical protein